MGPFLMLCAAGCINGVLSFMWKNGKVAQARRLFAAVAVAAEAVLVAA